jgi:hypothetical protein
MSARGAPFISLVEINAAVRRAWRQAGRTPVWPAKPIRPRGGVGASQQGLRAATFNRLLPVLHLVGFESDTEVARRSRSQRPLISWLRAALNIAARPRTVITRDQRLECLRRLRAREPLSKVAQSLGIGVVSARKLANSIGWDESWTRHHRGAKPAKQIGRLSRVYIETELRKGANRSHLAQLAGVSHQRIGQIAVYAGIPSRKELLRPKRLAARLAKEWFQNLGTTKRLIAKQHVTTGR